MADARHEGCYGIADRRVGILSVDDLHQLHQRHGVEEMGADHALGPLATDGDGSDGQSRGVGGEDAVFGDGSLQFGDEPPLGIQVFNDGLNDHPARLQRFDLRDQLQPANSRLGLRNRHEPLFGRTPEHGCYADRGILRGGNRQIGQQHGIAGRNGDLRDAASHGAGADDSDCCAE